MAKFTVALPAKWERFLKRLADDHQTDMNSVISELCEWAFSNPESKKQFEAWLDDAFPSRGEVEDKARRADEDISEDEEEQKKKSEEKVNGARDYSGDR